MNVVQDCVIFIYPLGLKIIHLIVFAQGCFTEIPFLKLLSYQDSPLLLITSYVVTSSFRYKALKYALLDCKLWFCETCCRLRFERNNSVVYNKQACLDILNNSRKTFEQSLLRMDQIRVIYLINILF